MLISKEPIVLSEKNLQFIRSGWGEAVTENTNVWKIVYKSGDAEVEGYFASPKDAREKLPLVIWNRGGARKAGAIDEFLARGMYGEIASWGYSVLATQYRKDEEFGGKDLDDVLNLFELANEFDECDTSRIGMEGWSRGGMMTYLTLTKTKRLKCAVIISGLADVVRNEKTVPDMSDAYKKLFGTDDGIEFVNRMKQRSAVEFYKNISVETPVLLIHGTADKRVSYNDSKEMFEKLKSNGNEVELITIQDGDHYLKESRREVAGYRRNWYEKYLKN